MSAAEPETPVEALQEALAGEHAAFHVYGVLGARTSYSQQSALYTQITEAWTAHRAARDRLTALVTAQGGDPVAAAVAYRPPGGTGTASQLRATALEVERRMTRIYADLVGHTAGRDRRWAIGALRQSALRELVFGGRPERFPGLD